MGEKLTGDFRKYTGKKFLGAWDVPDGADLILTIDHVELEEVQNEKGKEDKPVLFFREKNAKPMVCNPTNAGRIANVYKDQRTGKLCWDMEKWSGKRVSIYTENVTAFGKTSEALRIREYIPRDPKPFCEDCGEEIADEVINGKMFRAKAIAERSRSKYGRVLCMDCARAEKERLESDPDAYEEDLNRQVANEREEMRDDDV